MDEGVFWGAICSAWVVVIAIPYLYATGRTMIGRDGDSDRLAVQVFLPWTIGFAILLGLWKLGAEAQVGFVYSALAIVGAGSWLVCARWRKAKAIHMVEPASTPGASVPEKPPNMLLSKTQRLILVAIAALVGVILAAQIDEEGLADSPWLLGLVVIAGLLLLAFAPRRS